MLTGPPFITPPTTPRPLTSAFHLLRPPMGYGPKACARRRASCPAGGGGSCRFLLLGHVGHTASAAHSILSGASLAAHRDLSLSLCHALLPSLCTRKPWVPRQGQWRSDAGQGSRWRAA